MARERNRRGGQGEKEDGEKKLSGRHWHHLLGEWLGGEMISLPAPDPQTSGTGGPGSRQAAGGCREKLAEVSGMGKKREGRSFMVLVARRAVLTSPSLLAPVGGFFTGACSESGRPATVSRRSLNAETNQNCHPTQGPGE